MNRPIRFKAWCYAEQKWASNLTIYPGGSFQVAILKTIDSESILDWRHYRKEDVLVQWTGFYDLLGVPIWESDIVYDIAEGYFQVFWRSDLAQFVARMDGICDLSLGLNQFKWKVVGNIFENPELLNQLP